MTLHECDYYLCTHTRNYKISGVLKMRPKLLVSGIKSCELPLKEIHTVRCEEGEGSDCRKDFLITTPSNQALWPGRR